MDGVRQFRLVRGFLRADGGAELCGRGNLSRRGRGVPHAEQLDEHEVHPAQDCNTTMARPTTSGSAICSSTPASRPTLPRNWRSCSSGPTRRSSRWRLMAMDWEPSGRAGPPVRSSTSAPSPPARPTCSSFAPGTSRGPTATTWRSGWTPRTLGTWVRRTTRARACFASNTEWTRSTPLATSGSRGCSTRRATRRWSTSCGSARRSKRVCPAGEARRDR